MESKSIAKFIRAYVEKGAGLDSHEWDGFISCRHTDRIVDAASIIAFGIGIECPPQKETEWCSAEGRRRLRALADALSEK